MKQRLLPAQPDTLKPRVHCKIEQMNPQQLAMLDRIMLQIEAEDRADRLGEAFDEDWQQDKLRRIPELVQQYRAGHPYT